MAKQPPPHPPKRHASSGLFTLILALGGVLAGLGALTAALGMVGLGVVYVALGVAVIAYGRFGRVIGVAVQLVNTSLNLIGQGRLADSEKLLDQAEKRSRHGAIKRLVYVQRSLIALRRGDVDQAIGHADVAIAVPLGWMQRIARLQQQVNAFAIRAVLRASRGDRAGAEADVAVVRKTTDAVPQALARAALAEAILLERSGDREGLRALLVREREVLLDATDARERAIVRAYQRMLKAGKASVYRKGAAPDAPAGEEPPLGDWMAKVAPGAAPFARAGGGQPASQPIDVAIGVTAEARKRIAVARAAGARGAKRWPVPALIVGVVLAVGAAAMLWSSFAPPSGAEETPREFVPPGLPVSTLVVLVLGAAIGARLFIASRQRRQVRKLLAATALCYRESFAAGEAEFVALSTRTHPLIAAQAFLARAQIAERRGDAEATLALCDAGIGQLSRYAIRVAASDLLLPTLIAQRAFALAMLDRFDEADAEVASLDEAYAFLGRSRFRVRLVALARMGDVQAARLFVESRPMDLPLGPRDELLADVIRAVAAPSEAGAGEIERLKDELRVDRAALAWIERVAPGWVSRLGAPDERERDVDVEAEREAMAEAEFVAVDRPSSRLA